MAYVERLGELLTKTFGDRESYCVFDENGKMIAGSGCYSFCIEPCKTGGWRVISEEPGRGVVYKDYHLDTEREACIKFLEMTDKYYHLGNHVRDFQE